MSDDERQDRASASDAGSEAEKEKARRAEPDRVFAGTGLFWGLIFGVILALAVIILAAQNTDTVTISFLAWEFSTPLIVLILGALLIGVIVDELLGVVYRKRRRRTLRERDELKRLR